MKHPIFFCLLFFAGTILAQQPLSLSEAIELGLANNYQVKIAERDVEIAENSNDWAIAGRYPTVNFNLNSNNSYRNSNNPASVLLQSNSYNFNAAPSVEGSIVLFDGYRIRYTKEQLEAQENLSESNLQLAIQQSVQTIILSYYAALVEQERLEVLESVLNLSLDRVGYQEVRREFGQASTFDVLQTQDAYLNDSTSYLIQLNTYQNALRNLNVAMGMPDLETNFTLTDSLTFSAQAYDFNDLQQKMLANNVNLQNLFINRNLASIGTKIQEAARYPTINLNTGVNYDVSLSLGTQTFTFNNGQQQDIPDVAARTFTGFVNLAATYTIFDGGARNIRIQNAQLQEIQSQLNIDDLKLQLSGQLANTLNTYRNQKQLVQLTTELVENAQRNLEIAEERFRGGLINSFDYRTIQLGYINASQSRLDAIFNLKNTETELIRLTGGLVR